MENLDYVLEERVAHVRLNRGKSNAMNSFLINELNQLLTDLENDPAVRGLILHGKENFFSSGLDLIELYYYDESEARQFWNDFITLVKRFVSFSKPCVAAITGHSPAGGCVLAICCDYRVMVKGEYVIGLNELPVGIVVPEPIFDLYSFWIGRGNAYRNLMEGKLMEPEQALACGLVDELVAKESLVTTAEKQLFKYMALESNSWKRSKLNLRRSLIEVFDQDMSTTIEDILEQWWSPSTRSILKTIIENLSGSKK